MVKGGGSGPSGGTGAASGSGTVSTGNTEGNGDTGINGIYLGYTVIGGLSIRAPTDEFSRKQYIARTNRVIGGMLITQHRRAEGDCKTRFGSLGGKCQQGETLTGRYGVDPVFEMSAESLYSPNMDGDEALFYNTSAGN